MDLVGIKYALNAALGNSGFQALDELINSKITSAISSINTNTNNKTAAGAVKIVKSVQRGTLELPYDSTNYDVTISSVDTSKAILLYNLTGSGTNMDNFRDFISNWHIGGVLFSNKINFTRRGSDSSPTINWQVIEFY